VGLALYSRLAKSPRGFAHLGRDRLSAFQHDPGRWSFGADRRALNSDPPKGHPRGHSFYLTPHHGSGQNLRRDLQDHDSGPRHFAGQGLRGLKSPYLTGDRPGRPTAQSRLR
jgi:hypothetical protein